LPRIVRAVTSLGREWNLIHFETGFPTGFRIRLFTAVLAQTISIFLSTAMMNGAVLFRWFNSISVRYPLRLIVRDLQ